MHTKLKRIDVVNEVRSFKGAPFRHQGRSREYGVDCVGILVLLGCEHNYFEEREEDLRYPKNPEAFQIKEKLDEYLIPINKDNFDIGDILLFKIPFHPQHVGVVTNYSEQSYGIVQAYQTIGKVVEHRLDQKWLNRIVQAYCIPGVE